MSISSFAVEQVVNTPQQCNATECGVYTLLFADIVAEYIMQFASCDSSSSDCINSTSNAAAALCDDGEFSRCLSTLMHEKINDTSALQYRLRLLTIARELSR